MRREYDFSKGERGKFYQEGAKLNLPNPPSRLRWADGESPIVSFITDETGKTLRAYREQPSLVTEHANHEYDTARGGYAHRQLFELVQNGADALTHADGASILVRLTGEYLYCADDGTPIDDEGVQALMFSHMSSKRDTSEIGRFGLGFKSVLGVTDAPEFYSRSGSFRFDRHDAARRIAEVAPAGRYPVLRLPVAADAHKASQDDEDLREMMTWATNIVRLPLKPDAREDLSEQLKTFPPEFLLFVDHVRHLTLEDGERSRDFALRSVNGGFQLDTDKGSSRWKRFKTTHALSAAAMGDRRSLDDSGDVPISWAVPLDRLSEPGYYWSFFPTKTASYLAGILNAPWKTNEDRQNLLPGRYNDELIDAAARMVAERLPELATTQDPARHLDALPRRREAGDNDHGDRLRDRLDEKLHRRFVAPDQDGTLRRITDVSYAPRELTRDQAEDAALKKWASFKRRPRAWLHHSALTTGRMAKIDRLWRLKEIHDAPRSPLHEWLEALVRGSDGKDTITASMKAIQTAAAISEGRRRGKPLGDILVTRRNDWCTPDPERVFLSPANENSAMDDRLVHADLTSDAETADALKELGIRNYSTELRLRFLAKLIRNRFLLIRSAFSKGQLDNDRDSLILSEVPWNNFWDASRMNHHLAYEIIKNVFDHDYGQAIHVRVRSGDWRPLHWALLPGEIVPGENSRDREVTIDTEFHGHDLDLLDKLGATARPTSDRRLSSEPSFISFGDRCRQRFVSPDRYLPRNPQLGKLQFVSTIGSGPLEVMRLLSDEGKARYTDALLSLDGTYTRWTMRHARPIYKPLTCSNPAVEMLREHGRIQCADSYVPFKDILGPRPANQAALRVLLAHPKAARIKETFKLAEPLLEPAGEEEPVPLVDLWPGLRRYLSGQSRTALIRCERLEGADGSNGGQCVKVDGNVYLVGTGDEIEDLRLVTRELELYLDVRLEAILRYVPRESIAARRAAVRHHKTDAEKLLHAVREDNLRSGLPESLLAVLESERAPLAGVDLAQAAIATYHTAALKEYRHALDHLEPPARWAGSPSAVDFVRSLGFSAEWAGRPSPRRPPFLEVEGPCSLPELHDYQQHIVAKVRDMLCKGHVNGRRGMISLPTGSGKTRVAVQAVVEAMHGGFAGGVLWVADRDELCEQAVDAWRQVWASVGIEGKRLRVSRMWAGQPLPRPASEFHVIVATIQTLYAKLSRQPEAYRFLTDFNLVVFDEAHRSVARTYTSIMEDIGLTRWQRGEEPFLIGLTATPYRGHDEAETQRLVRRYGKVRLDAGAFASDEPTEVIGELQQMRVLAHADHQTIDGGKFSLSEDELRKMRDTPAWLPRSMEDRIARNADRTRRIVDAYREYVSREWPTLIFATSVEHAQTVAALLNSEGFSARAVSGGTETSVRRDIVERFRAGQIDVLVNYGVFREGFDAPKTRAIIVARPVYSPNLYFQMIGRGLRGPKNGGNERCLIVNVRDNIDNFDRALAFADLDWLWS